MSSKAGPWITTFTGVRFYPLTPVEDDISILDIAHSLSNICRFNGHCDPFYSVAEHSLRVSAAVPHRLQFLGLIHDAPEIYTTDMPSLWKGVLPLLKNAERRIFALMCRKFGIVTKPGDMVTLKTAEHSVLAAECRDLGINTDGWYLPEPPLPLRIVPMSSDEAEQAYLSTFMELAARAGSACMVPGKEGE